ncbi:MAG: hypothetical protein AUJ49_09065 [Desulfovibrionaceae bacterium CG1_02_65_16]|nr:MAG: hypothetical protein AUJ49_09065 [Desulfovibrionaceae bacterium CG1_02_65_16]
MLLLIALLVAFGVGYFLYQQEQRLALGVWPDLSIDAVQSLEVATPKERYTLLRETGGWVVRMDGGEADAVPVPADTARVEALLASIVQNRPRQTLDPSSGVDVSQLGFDAPTVQMLIKPISSDDRPARVTLGHETPTGAALYAHSSLAPEVVFLMDASVLHHFVKPADYYFDARLLDVRGEDVQRLTLYSAHGVQWDMERKDDLFTFTEPTNLKGTTLTASEVRLYLHNLTAITADVILTKPDRQAPTKPACVIEMLMPKASAPLRLELFPPLDGDQVYGRSSRHPGGFLLDKDKAKSLIRQAYDMQWRGVVNFDSTKVEGARIFAVMSNQTLAVDKSPTGWEDRDNGRKMSGIDMTLWRLKELRFEAEPVTRLAYPAAQRLVLDLLSKDGKVLSSFTFYSDPRLPADQCWLKVGSEEMFYPVSSQLLEDVQGYLPARQLKTP